MKHIVVLTGAGMSADSGLKTFRDSDGLWEGHDVMEVASVEGWINNQALVLNFYNERRSQAWHAKPNEGHIALARLEKHFRVSIITQNVDSLHEKAGSTVVVHLHGELRMVRSSGPNMKSYDFEDRPIKSGDLCDEGFQLRPDIVWFGEMVPKIDEASKIVSEADIFVIIGTSLVVYPAAGLLSYVSYDAPIYLVDPGTPMIQRNHRIKHIKKKSAEGTPLLIDELIQTYL
jgi:NAD-dependent deacetylase